MKLIFSAVMAVALLFGSGGTAKADDPSAQDILTASDKIRNPGKPFKLINTLTEYRSGKPVDSTSMTVFSKEDEHGQYRSLVRFDSPQRDQGKLVLKNGNDMWFYDDASKASVRLSPQQRLLGQASNGDVVTVNLAKDYKATLEGNETVTDADKAPRDCWKLALEAAAEGVTYWKIEYWVDKTTFRPVKGKFYSESGRLLKIAYYRGYQEILGANRPTETLIIDGVDTASVTRMETSDYAYRDIPDAWFQRDYLPRFTGE